MTTPLTEAREAEIRAREQAATPGPWTEVTECGICGTLHLCGRTEPRDHDGLEVKATTKDMAFIEMARSAVPDLLTALDAERAKVARQAEVVRMLTEAAKKYRRLSTHDTDCYREWVKADERLEAAFTEAAKDVTP